MKRKPWHKYVHDHMTDKMITGNFPLEGGVTEVETTGSKMLSLGFTRANDDVRNPRKIDFSKLSREGQKQEMFRQFIEKDREEREQAAKDAKRREVVHPFEMSPTKQLLRKPAVEEVEYDGLYIGNFKSAKEEKKLRREAAVQYKETLQSDISLGKSIKSNQESDDYLTANRKPYQRKITSVETDIGISEFFST